MLSTCKVVLARNGLLIQGRFSSTVSSNGKHRLQSPTARLLLGHYAINGDLVAATGPKDVLTKWDVLMYVKSNNMSPKSISTSETSSKAVSTSSPQMTASRTRGRKGPKFVDIELTNMRKIIAKRLTESKTTIPHSYITGECDISFINKIRSELKAQNVKVSINDFIVKGVALCLKKHPLINVKYDAAGDQVTPYHSVDISVAVATPNGLITPIIPEANSLTVEQISRKGKELGIRAREGKLQPHEFQGGSFTISNLGMMGIKEFSAVINPPQAGILAVGTGIPTLMTSDTDQVRLIHLMNLTLSYDARCYSEEEAALFMESLKELMENPQLMERMGDGTNNRRLASFIY